LQKTGEEVFMPSPVLIRDLAPNAFFKHIDEAGTASPPPELIYRVVEFRSRTVFVENGIGVRTTMSKKTQVLPVSEPELKRKAG
jgi:hypothetical protein